jgi:hypothetical protein
MRKGILTAVAVLALFAGPVFAASDDAGAAGSTGKPAATAKKKTHRHATGHKGHVAHRPAADSGSTGTK